MRFVQRNGVEEVLPPASTAAEQAQTLLQHHARVDRNRVLGNAEEGNRPLGLDDIDDLIDGRS